MNVLHLSSALTWRGGENQIQLLIINLQKLGVLNFLFCPLGSQLTSRLESLNVEQINYKKRSGLGIRSAILLRGAVRKLSIDLIHVHDSHSHNYACINALLGDSTPIVVTRRVDFKLKPFSRIKYNHPCIKKIVCISRAVQKVLRKGGVFKNKIITIHDTVDTGISLNQKGKLRATQAIDEKQKVVAFVGALAEHKDPLTFVRMCAELVKYNNDYPIYFVMIGEDYGMKKVIEKAILDFELGKVIELTGFINNMHYVWPDIDVLVVTSKEEGLCSTVLEAFVYGIPVVATSAGGLKELVLHEKTGLLTQIGDKNGIAKEVRRILNDLSLREELKNNSKKWVRKFDCLHQASAYHRVYKEVLNPRLSAN